MKKQNRALLTALAAVGILVSTAITARAGFLVHQDIGPKVEDIYKGLLAACESERRDLKGVVKDQEAEIEAQRTEIARLTCRLDCYQPHPTSPEAGVPGDLFGGSEEAPSCPSKPALFGGLAPDACTSCLQKCDE
jgi:hypothetical protein